jgi:hypothetical protein
VHQDLLDPGLAYEQLLLGDHSFEESLEGEVVFVGTRKGFLFLTPLLLPTEAAYPVGLPGVVCLVFSAEVKLSAAFALLALFLEAAAGLNVV